MNFEESDVVIIDYQLGNLFSVNQACIYFGLTPKITNDIKIILNAKAIILPGVGAFGDAMHNLNKLDLISPIKDFAASGKPVFGICLGMQLLFEESEEFGINSGLGIIPGFVKRFPDHHNGNKLRIPYIGWNPIFNHSLTWHKTPLENIEQNEYMYFVHSFYAQPSDNEDILSYSVHKSFEYCSSIQNKNIFATQFHPEKSALKGLDIYKNWINYFLSDTNGN